MLGHIPELLIIMVLALIVFGPEKLPEMAANAGKMVREFQHMMENAMHPHQEDEVPDDFSSYYYESLARSGENVPDVDFAEEVPEDEHPTESGATEDFHELPDDVDMPTKPVHRQTEA